MVPPLARAGLSLLQEEGMVGRSVEDVAAFLLKTKVRRGGGAARGHAIVYSELASLAKVWFG